MLKEEAWMNSLPLAAAVKMVYNHTNPLGLLLYGNHGIMTKGQKNQYNL